MLRPQNLSAPPARGGNVGNVRASGVGEAGGFRARKTTHSALLALPGDLAAWLRATPTRDVARVLNVSEGRVRQLRTGNGRAVSPEILRRWAAHQAQCKLPALPWQVRKVAPDGTLWLLGQQYASAALAVYAGRQVLVAPLAGGGVLVQPIAPSGGIQAQPVPQE